MKPANAIKLERVPQVAVGTTSKLSARQVQPLSVGTMVYVTANEEAKGVDEKRRATDPWWTAKTHAIARRIDKPGQESLYYFAPAAGQGKHGYTRSQLKPA
jgi:hypothetical protein